MDTTTKIHYLALIFARLLATDRHEQLIDFPICLSADGPLAVDRRSSDVS
jgi:hypothetical protein